MKTLWKVLAVLGALAGLALFLITRNKDALPDLGTQFRAIDAEAEAKKLAKELETEKAIQAVKEKHREDIEALEEEEAREIEESAGGDPGKLARRLVEAGARARR